MGRFHRASTPAEMQARDQARTAKLQALHATLTEQIAALRGGQDWQDWLKVAARFHTYSFNNVLLIAAQRPGATAVAGFEAWKTLGRQVDKGERGIQILAPVIGRPAAGRPAAGGADPPARTQPTAEPVDTGPQDQTASSAGADPTGPARRPSGFRVAHVFDIAQTSGEPLPERPVPQLLAGQAPAGLWDALAGEVTAHGFTLERGPCLGGTANGLTNYTSRTVTVRADVEAAQAVKTLAHELAHVLLHDPTGPASIAGSTPASTGQPVVSSAEHCRGRIEVEAESVAYLVTYTHGLDSGAYTFPYVAGWAGSVDAVTPETVVRATGERVLRAARVVLAATEHLGTGAADSSVLDDDRARALQDRAEHGAQRTSQLAAAAAQQSDQAAASQHIALTAPTVTPVQSRPADAGQLPRSAAQDGPETERLVAVHELAVAFYTDRLHTAPDGRPAAALLTQRGVDQAAALQSGLGYAPRAWTRLVEHLRDEGIGDAELLASGLVLTSARGALVDRFRDRIIFPIRDSASRTIALLGRAVDQNATDRSGQSVPKYLNSPDTALYRKSEVLYGLDDAASAALSAGAVPVLVEGPMDTHAVDLAGRHLPGPGGAPAFVGLASCGTALTAAQVALLDDAVGAGGLAQRGVVVAFDGDPAGTAAGLRAYDLLRAVRCWPHAVALPAGQDPSGVLQQHGPSGLHAALRTAQGRPLADLVVDDRVGRYSDHLRWAEGQLAASRAAATVIAAMPPEHVGRQIVRLAARLDMPADEISGLVVDAVTRPSRPNDPLGQPPMSPSSSGPRLPRSNPPAADAGERVPGRPGLGSGPPVRPGNAAAGRNPAQRARAGFPVPLTQSLGTVRDPGIASRITGRQGPWPGRPRTGPPPRLTASPVDAPVWQQSSTEAVRWY